MNTLDFVLAIISIISFLLAIFSIARTEIKKAAEKANIEVMKERIESLYQGLVSVYHTTDAIVQIPKSQETDIQELQNLGRISRSQVYILLKKIEKERNRLKVWKFGKMIPSEPVEDISPKEKFEIKKVKD